MPMTVDLLEFFHSGKFGQLDGSLTSERIVELLGESDPGHFVGQYVYGSVVITVRPHHVSRSVYIDFPHPVHVVRFNSFRTGPIRELAKRLDYASWPDPRFKMSLGPFRPDITVSQLSDSLARVTFLL